MNEDQLREWLDREDAEQVLLSAPVSSLGAQFDSAVLLYIQTRISILLKAYPTTIQEDEQLLLRQDLSKIHKLVIAHRITEKTILNRAVEYCKLKVTEIDLQQVHIQ